MVFVGAKLDLPNEAEQIAFRAFDSVLRSDPTLRRVVKTWSSYKGEQVDTLPPCPATCPLVQISARPAGASWEAEGLHREPLYIMISAAVSGLDIDNMLNLWGAIRRAVFPKDPARDEFVANALRTDAKVVKATIISPAIEQIADKKDGQPNMIFARGLVELLLHVPT